ncbi:MAG: DUF1800 domain-containing protein [Acidobacteria bacterium]|nr:DUF1800 domain-containing protein [Acidobacteriota bacterium]
MARDNWSVEHLLRRAAFGPDATDLARFADTPVSTVVAYLVDYERQPDDVDAKIDQSPYVAVATRGGQFSPNTNIEDARQRWLFRMVHSRRPLQEKMALFWHNHFATTYSKVGGTFGAIPGTKMMALKAGELPGPQGQLELFRQYALGNFRDLLIEVARDPAMIVFLDGRTNVRARPQENFGREIMELFTFGVGNYTEQDVYAAARVFTGWNLRNPTNGPNDNPNTYYQFFYDPNQHDPTAKTFTFPIYGDGGQTIPARAAADGMQDGVDFISALARHPETARRLARKLWNFFVSELEAPDPAFVEGVATQYLRSDTELKPVVRYILNSPWFSHPDRWHTRYSWPAEFVVRSIREVGWQGLSVDSLRTPMTNMGQTLFEPPDVSGWELGSGWFTTGAMLARMNFATTLAANQRFNLARAATPHRESPESLLDFFLDRLSPYPYEYVPRSELLAYLRAGGAWTGSDAQLNVKTAGLAKLIVGSAEYQFV